MGAVWKSWHHTILGVLEVDLHINLETDAPLSSHHMSRAQSWAAVMPVQLDLCLLNCILTNRAQISLFGGFVCQRILLLYWMSEQL